MVGRIFKKILDFTLKIVYNKN
jgi:hypothetical protein